MQTSNALVATTISAGCLLLAASGPDSCEPDQDPNRLVIQAGVRPVGEVVNAIATFVGVNLVENGHSVSLANPFEVEHDIKLTRENALGRVVELFATRDLVFVPICSTPPIYEVVTMTGPGRGSAQAAATMLPLPDLFESREETRQVRCIVPIRKLEVPVAMKILRARFSEPELGTKLIVGTVGADNCVLLQGWVSQVRDAARSLQEEDANVDGAGRPESRLGRAVREAADKLEALTTRVQALESR